MPCVLHDISVFLDMIEYGLHVSYSPYRSIYPQNVSVSLSLCFLEAVNLESIGILVVRRCVTLPFDLFGPFGRLRMAVVGVLRGHSVTNVQF